MEIKKELLRSIPKVDEVLAQPQVKKAMEEGRSQVTDGVRQVLDGLREQILRGEEPDLTLEGVTRAVLQQVEENSRMSLRPVINGTGIVLHTNLGRAVMCHEAAQAAMDVAENYNTLEYDCEKGRRGSRYSHVENFASIRKRGRAFQAERKASWAASSASAGTFSIRRASV